MRVIGSAALQAAGIRPFMAVQLQKNNQSALKVVTTWVNYDLG
jgi:hypothetical protein